MTNVKFATDRGECRRLLGAVQLFADLPEPLLAGLGDSASLLRVEAGRLLFREGDPAEHFLLVRRGCVEMLRFTSDGEERVFHLFGEGQLIAEAAMFMPHGRYPMNARSQSSGEFYRLGRAALRKACESHPALAMRMLESLSLRLYHQVNEVDWLTASSPATWASARSRSAGCFPTGSRPVASRAGCASGACATCPSCRTWRARRCVRSDVPRRYCLERSALRSLR
ncbi:Crp/Fnr family transcriptional regulator [Pseudomonas aeruginosa]|uniref:Crp/Fnr family transcriptional regulator n=1 Tax=Pseudomonas aeruginosa TaxID=287 RepID=UPI000B328646